MTYGSLTMRSITPTQSGRSSPTTTSAPMESAVEIYAASFKPLQRTEEETGKPPSPLYHTSGGPLENTEKSHNWPTSSSTTQSIQSGTYYTEGSRISPEEYEIGTVHSPKEEVPMYWRDKNTPYYCDLKTSPSISGLEILKPIAGTASSHGNMPTSLASATGSRNLILSHPHPTPDQPLNPAMMKVATEMEWLELLEWQGRSLANEGSWLISEATKFMYQTQLPSIV
ncbi:uncharacterized protein EV420DRAFT_1644366 [Desarmillaria tabescens]|uniref:Uncharacterized protein n=1 Tax=Armillaria tabescens TaxID=1929756 RepID=A0AA39K9Q8_ARMTA|nr:uncharacterized protein EV420DRAFT_1644366 [Desarmillaria tabescens]KAK0457191.1 hypothetical protein EV420DRAFT_1644366 [Desarmillaria tabescens]